MNPGGSVKDRAGRQMILEAENARRTAPRRPGGGGDRRQYRHRAGAGRQCARLSHAHRHPGNAKPGKEGRAAAVRRRTGRGAGDCLFSNPNNYQHVGRRLAEQLKKTEKNGVIFADQWNNLDNSKAHYVSTAPEIWDETGGKIDGFICSVGSGGTFAGVSRYLREKNKDVVIGVADPRGAAMYNLFTHGEAKATEGGSITEGIGLGRVTAIVEEMKVDKAYLIPDEEAVPIIFDLLLHEGLCLGGSSGINVAGAIRLAKDLGPGHTIVTVLADYGTRYQSKLFNPDFLRSKNLPVPDWLERKSDIKPPFEKT